MTAAGSASGEAEFWRAAAESLSDIQESVGSELTEMAVTGFDPRPDLARRARRWSHRFDDHSAVSLTAFAAGLAEVESGAWERDDPIIATQALSDRRFLFGDRIVHWLVPVLLAIAEDSVAASALAGELLDLGDRHRPAPALTGSEGLYPPGHDSIGPIVESLDGAPLLNGWITDRVHIELFRQAGERWRTCAEQHPGTARLWLDLAARCDASAARVIMS